MAVQRNTSGARTARGAGTGANGPSGGPSQNNRSGKPRKRRISKKQQAIYRRRRIVAGTVLLLMVIINVRESRQVFCVYSLGRGIGAVNSMIHHDEVYAISRDATPAPKKVSNVKDCSASDVTLQLSAASQSVPVGGSLDFTATIVHEGSGNCLVDGSDSGRVLTITSGQETIYKSDVCPADSRLLLMAKGDKDVQKVTWNTNANATLAKCTDESGWAKVNAGTYVAQLSLKDHPKVKSDPVTFTVQ